MKGLARHMVPIGQRLVIDQKNEPVIKSTGRKVVDLPVDYGRQTDARIAYASKADNVGFASQAPLRHVVVGNFPHQQGTPLTTKFDNKDFYVRTEAGSGKELTVIGRLVAFEIVGPAKAGPGDVKMFRWHHHLLSISSSMGQRSEYQGARFRLQETHRTPQFET